MGLINGRRRSAVWLLAPLLALAAVAALTFTARPPSASPEPSASAPPAGASPSASAVARVTPSPEPTSTPSPTPVLVIDPLTGMLVSPEQARLPVIAVMIDDHSAARPQSGFNAAGIVWQAPAEGGIPRYELLFHATVPTAVGPVRSAREYFVEWAAEWRAMYAHAGGSPQALQTLRTNGGGKWVWNADEFAWGSYFHRVTFNVPPHNLYTDGTNLEALAKRLGVAAAPDAPYWTFRSDVPIESRPIGGSITVGYATETITFRYDAATNTYRRYLQSSKAAQVDAGDHALVAPKNVVVLRMSFGPLNDGHPNKHRLEAADVGHGTAWISSNGLTVKGTWRKASETAPTLLFGPDGKPAVLTAGQTFVEVMQLSDLVSIQAGQAVVPPPLDPKGLTPR